MGEKKEEILQVMDDLRTAAVDFLTIGQYLQPSSRHYPLQRYYHPNEFEELKNIALLTQEKDICRPVPCYIKPADAVPGLNNEPSILK